MPREDMRHAPLPARLTSAERDFHIELRRLVDAAGLSAAVLGGTGASEAAWESWIDGQSLPPQRVVRELVSRLAAGGADAGRLAELWARAFRPTQYPAEPGRSLIRPRQLPLETGVFTGRADELKVLGDLARQASADGGGADGATGSGSGSGTGGPTVIVIDGPTGTGKTALANRAAHQVSDLFPDGQLWAGLHGNAAGNGSGDADEPVTGEQALHGFLEALGVAPGQTPSGADEQAALYRKLLTGRRVLIVLDDARDVGQVRQLLPASRGCLVLVTARTPLSGLDGTAAHLLRLGPLSEGDARDLLERHLGAERIGRERSAADELSRRCGRLPLILSLAAARAAAEPDLPLRAFATELDPGSRGADDSELATRTVLGASYAHLSNGAARMFRLLSLSPGPDIGLPATASLAAIPVSEARAALDELTAACFVDEHQPDRFAVHDLLRSYAADRARASETTSELDDATRRLLDHYLRAVHAAIPHIAPSATATPLVPTVAGVRAESFRSPAQALAWWHAERPAALSLVTLAARHGGFDAYCWQLPWAMAGLLMRGGFFHDFLAVQRVAITAAARTGDPFAQGTAHYQYAHACALIGEVGESDTHLKAALDWFTTAGDQAWAARALTGMASVLTQKGDYRQALDREKEALELRRGVGDPEPIAHSELGLADICARLGRHDEAVRHCQRSLDITRETGNRAQTADALDTLGSLHLSLGEHARAVACYMEALAIYRVIGDNVATAGTLTGLGDARQASGDSRAARAAWRQALAILGELPNADTEPVRARLAGLA